MRIYIAGPMSGLPENNYPAFFTAADALRADGYTVENPAANPEPPCGSWAGYMRRALAQLVTCEAVHFLPGSSESRGARLEYRVAVELGLEISGPPATLEALVEGMR